MMKLKHQWAIWSPIVVFTLLVGFLAVTLPGCCSTLAGIFSEPLDWEGYRDVAWSPDGRIIAVAGQGVFLFDEALEEKGFLAGQEFNKPENAYSLAWSPDANELAIKFNTGISIVSVDDLVEHRLLFSGSDIAWSPAADLLAVSSNDFRKKGELYIYETELGFDNKPVVVLSGHGNWITAFGWSPDGRKIVTASLLDGSIRVWDTMTGAELYLLGHPAAEGTDFNRFSLAWSPDSRYLATGNTDGYIRIWNAETGDEVRVFSSSTRYGVFAMSWSPDQHAIAAVNDRGVEIRSADTGKFLRKCDIPKDGDVQEAVWNPAGTRLVGIGSIGFTRYVWLWNADTGELLNTFTS